MPTDHRATLAAIKTFPSLVAYLRDEMNWPIERDSFEDVDDLFFDYTAEELGIEAKSAAKIRNIRRLRPLTANQPWGIFFVEFEPKKLPVVALRRILGQVVQKSRATAKGAERIAWSMNDLLFISNYGEGEERKITFAHFAEPDEKHDLPTLKVVGWDEQDTASHLDLVGRELTEHLAWPDDEGDVEEWRRQWRAAFTLRHREVITTSKQLSIALARLARNIREQIARALAIETERGPLTKLMNAFRESLLHDLKPDDFADMYAQTIAYGLLSARIADPESKTADDFARHMRTNPFLRELMETFLHVGGRRGKKGDAGIDFDELGVNDVVELLDRANMAAVVADFGDRNPEEDPVIHFYELFLKEYDAKKRMQRGVFYTPKPVVSYIVRSVDELLRSEFGLPDGLADMTTWGEMAARHEGLQIPEGTSPEQPFVQILDPACGTGTFLVEVIDLIHRTLVTRWKKEGHGAKTIEELWNDYVPQFLLPRLHGYELLMAPYAIAHLKIGLKLHETGYHFGSDERARVFLTNALEPPSDVQFRLSAMPALAHEAQAVNEVKRDNRFTAVLGNPPYSKSSQNQGAWISGLMEHYKRTVRTAETQIQALSDDYVKFLRLSHFLIENANSGVIGLITNNGWLDGPIFRDIRSAILGSFSDVHILNLHGDSRKRATPPNGFADENVFDIQQGVAISLLARKKATTGAISYEAYWGTREQRYTNLLVDGSKGSHATSIRPVHPHFLFIPVEVDLEAEFAAAWHLYDVFGTGDRNYDNHESYGAGFVTQQDSFAVGWSPDDIVANVAEFVDPSSAVADLKSRFRFCSTNQWDFDRARRELRVEKVARHVRRCLYRPFDYRFTVFDRNICTIVRERITSQFDRENLALLTTRRVTRLPYNNVFVSDCYAEYKVASHDRNTIVFPLWIYPIERGRTLSNECRSNISPSFVAALSAVVGSSGREPEMIFPFLYATLHSPAYRERYGAFLTIDFARIFLPRYSTLFEELAAIGRLLIRCHTLSDLPPAQAVDFMGAKKQVEKVSWTNECVWLNVAQTSYFSPISDSVWNFHIGGYQVCEKWLKDRKGRILTDDDIEHYKKIVAAVSDTIRLMKEIDEVIERHGGWPGAFVTEPQTSSVEAEMKPRLRVVDAPAKEERYRSFVPLVPLQAAATDLAQGAQLVDEGNWPWVEVTTKHRLRPGMFVAQVVGRSMEPAIPDGAYCLFASPVEGSRQGRTVLVKLHRGADPESGAHYTVKRYRSEKVAEEESWRHGRIVLEPVNRDFEPLVFEDSPDESFAVVAELIEVLDGTPDRHGDAPAPANSDKRPTQRQLVTPPRQRTASFPTHGLFAPRADAAPSSSQEPTDDDDDRHHHEHDDDGEATPRRRFTDQFSVDDVLLHVREVVCSSEPIPRDDAIREIARRLGAARVGARIRDLIESALNTASRRFIIETVAGGLIPGTRTIDDYHRDFLKTALRNVTGRTWTDEDEAIRAATRWLGFRRTGPKIEQAFRSAIRGALMTDDLERDGSMLRIPRE